MSGHNHKPCLKDILLNSHTLHGLTPIHSSTITWGSWSLYQMCLRALKGSEVVNSQLWACRAYGWPCLDQRQQMHICKANQGDTLNMVHGLYICENQVDKNEWLHHNSYSIAHYYTTDITNTLSGNINTSLFTLNNFWYLLIMSQTIMLTLQQWFQVTRCYTPYH